MPTQAITVLLRLSRDISTGLPATVVDPVVTYSNWEYLDAALPDARTTWLPSCCCPSIVLASFTSLLRLKISNIAI